MPPEFTRLGAQNVAPLFIGFIVVGWPPRLRPSGQATRRHPYDSRGTAFLLTNRPCHAIFI
jgi:hypothetical protein